MQADLHQSHPHKAMRQIIDKSLVGEASPQEQQALRKHLPVCAACQKYASDSRRAIAALGGFSFPADPGLQAKVHASLALRAQQLHAAQPNRRRQSYQNIVQVSLVALLLTLVGSFGAMNLGDSLAMLLHLSPTQTQAGLLTFWIVPSCCFSLLLPLLLLSSGRSANKKGQTT
jgi:anti-sigma factor RsiW